MALRVLTWNMNYWQQRSDHDAAWAYLDDLDWDVALLQEAVVPGGVDGRRHLQELAESLALARGVRPSSAVIPWSGSTPLQPATRRPPLRSTTATPAPSLPPSCTRRQGGPITAVSVYGLIEYGYAVTTLHRILSDLTPLFDTSYGQRVVVGGDLNCSTQLAPPHRARHKTVFDRFASLGLVNVTERPLDDAVLHDCPCVDEPCRHVRTHFHSRSQKPWQDDYVFLSAALATKARCEVLDRGPTDRPLSDHAPVIVSIT